MKSLTNYQKTLGTRALGRQGCMSDDSIPVFTSCDGARGCHQLLSQYSVRRKCIQILYTDTDLHSTMSDKDDAVRAKAAGQIIAEYDQNNYLIPERSMCQCQCGEESSSHPLFPIYSNYDFMYAQRNEYGCTRLFPTMKLKEYTTPRDSCLVICTRFPVVSAHP